jgi:hypothetical protein
MISPAEALREHAHLRADGRWWFTSPAWVHDETSALAIVEACLLLDMPVTDMLTTQAWLRLIDKVTQLQERLDRIEAAQ